MLVNQYNFDWVVDTKGAHTRKASELTSSSPVGNSDNFQVWEMFFLLEHKGLLCQKFKHITSYASSTIEVCNFP